MNNTYWMETYGCQMNIAESQALENALQEGGWMPAESEDNSAVVILNTCSVRKTAENRIWGRLGFFSSIKSKRSLTIIVMGCMGERLRDSFKKDAPMVDYVFGTQDQHLIPQLLIGESGGDQGMHSVGSESEHSYSFRKSHQKEGSFKAYVPIMHGCNNFCTYCIVPYVRGREVSRNPEDIYKEIEALSQGGVKKVTLLGQNVNSYTWGDLDFPDLLRGIVARSGDIVWIDFLSSHPKDLSPKLIEVIAEEPKITRNIHLPVQHGSSRILQRMNRGYSREEYSKLITELRKAVPELTVTSDIMVGFPGETEEDLEELISLMREVRFIQSFTYFYNPREGTKAAEYPDQLSDEVKKDRLARIITLQHEIGQQEHQKMVDTCVTVLVEGPSRKSEDELLGRTQSDSKVVFPHNGRTFSVGDSVQVYITELQGNTLRGTFVDSEDV